MISKVHAFYIVSTDRGYRKLLSDGVLSSKATITKEEAVHLSSFFGRVSNMEEFLKKHPIVETYTVILHPELFL